MNHAISTELQFFFISILWGAIILLAYDVLRIIRRIIKHNSFVLAIQDILFWAFTSVFIFAMIYTENNGIIRGFSVMGVTIGMVLYHYIFSDIIVGSITKLIQILLTPFNLAINMVKRFFRFVLLKVKKVANFIIRRLKKHSKSFKMKINVRRQASEEKRKKKQEQKAIERKKKDELIQAKRIAKEKQREKEGKSKKASSKKKSDQRSAARPDTGLGTANSEGNRLIVDKRSGAEPRRVVELVLDSTTGNRVGKNTRTGSDQEAQPDSKSK